MITDGIHQGLYGALSGSKGSYILTITDHESNRLVTSFDVTRDGRGRWQANEYRGRSVNVGLAPLFVRGAKTLERLFITAMVVTRNRYPRMEAV